MDKKWNQLIRNLYDKIDKSHLSDEEIALEYTKLWWTNETRNPYNRFENHIDINEYNNLALLNQFEDKFNICRKTLLISDMSILWEPDLNIKSFCIDSYKDTYPGNYIDTSEYDYNTYLMIDDINILGRFIKNNRRLIESNYSIYIPRIECIGKDDNYLLGELSYTLTPSENLFKKLLDSKNSTSCTISRKFIEDNYLRIITEIEIPYIDYCSDDIFVNIINKYEKEFNRFRLYIREEMERLNEVNGSDLFDTSIKRIGIDIERGINALNSDIKKLDRHIVIRAGNYLALGSIVVTLVAINGVALNMSTLGELLTYLGTGGGIISLSNFIEDCLNRKQDIKEQPYYFVWLLHKKC